MKLVCVAPDGDYVTELEESTLEECTERSANMGSRWIFYPLHFILSDTGLTVKETPDHSFFEEFKNKRFSTVINLLKKYPNQLAMCS